jgi:hypothetical protein
MKVCVNVMCVRVYSYVLPHSTRFKPSPTDNLFPISLNTTSS